MAIVLAVDDDVDDLEFLEAAIKNVDDTIVTIKAYDGLQALKLLDSISPDYIFLDINMPLMNGMDCLRKIRGDSRFKTIPITMISTTMSTPDVSACADLRAGFVKKPNNYNDLKDIITEVFKMHAFRLS